MIRELASSFKYRYKDFKKRNYYRNVLRTIENPLFVDGYPDTENFGDALNLFLGEYLSGRKVFPSRRIETDSYSHLPFYAVIGSICQQAQSNSVIWGSGFISDSYVDKTFVEPRKICAVRGPLTRKIYLENKINCPSVYGDPALLLPLIHNPEIEVTNEYGFIPHYSDMGTQAAIRIRNRSDVLTIDLMIGDDYNIFVQKLKSCKKIITSSLHGMILSHSYGIPVCRVKLSDNLIGGDFKFNDYLLSVNKLTQSPQDLSQKISLELTDLEFDSDPIKNDVRPLIESCPFITENIKKELLKRAVYYD